MTDDREDETDVAPNDGPADERASNSSGFEAVVANAIGRLRSDPVLWLPFLLAGLLSFAIDRRRAADALPVEAGVDDATVSVAYAIYPSGVTETVRPLGALVDLRLPSLAYALGLEALAVLAVAGAGWLTIARARGDPLRPERFGRYLLLVVGVGAGYRLLEAVGVGYGGGSLLSGLAVLALAFAVLVRLFLWPALVLRGEGVAASLAKSWRDARGQGWTILGLILLIGLGAWALAHAPVVGTVLSVWLVGTIHAVSLVALLERT
ncbi:hypothetical protein [Natrarchaeobius oligotrophus]|uniref:DUF4013 domain-containing protein n=1 Tax=Natrarchaeobius chitinivorans TaxID=1679083 RepID=A0A3N6PP04_NATCH|nr:hypothetical protein [Natrarchaeobius chitinivorans]RQH00856.1 hypothetical protein EA472_09520 [Natrarchaeobius chitinivorans]